MKNETASKHLLQHEEVQTPPQTLNPIPAPK